MLMKPIDCSGVGIRGWDSGGGDCADWAVDVHEEPGASAGHALPGAQGWQAQARPAGGHVPGPHDPGGDWHLGDK